MEENKIVDYHHSFLNGDRNVVLPVWSGIKYATKLPKLYDSSKCLTFDDFDQLGMIGVLNAFNSFSPSRGKQLRTWTIELSNQSMLRGVFKRQLDSVPLFSVSYEEIFESLMLKISTNFEPSFIFEEYYQKIIDLVSIILYKKNRKIHTLFKFKLANPDLDASAVMNKLNISTVYYRYLEFISEAVKEVLVDL